jgi:hypothetical protein
MADKIPFIQLWNAFEQWSTERGKPAGSKAGFSRAVCAVTCAIKKVARPGTKSKPTHCFVAVQFLGARPEGESSAVQEGAAMLAAPPAAPNGEPAVELGVGKGPTEPGGQLEADDDLFAGVPDA